MNDYFLHHAIDTAKKQIKRSGVLLSEINSKDLIYLAIQLAIVEKLEILNNTMIDVESEIQTLLKKT